MAESTRAFQAARRANAKCASGTHGADKTRNHYRLIMGSEAALRSMVLTNLGPYGRIKRIESPIDAGTPDISWLLRVGVLPAIAGWCELKYLQQWPVRPDTPVRIPSLTLEQTLWARGWEEIPGGRAPLLLQVGRDYCLFAGHALKQMFLVSPQPKATLVKRALVYSTGMPFPTTALLKALTSQDYNSYLHKGRNALD